MNKSLLFVLSFSFVFVACGGAQDRESSDSEEEAAEQVTEPASEEEVPSGPVASETMGVIDQEAATRGEGLFTAKGCVGCHKVGEGRLVGPDLAGVADRRSEEWIMGMITNPDSMLANDDTAGELLAQYFTRMPNQGLTESEARSLLHYLRRESQ